MDWLNPSLSNLQLLFGEQVEMWSHVRRSPGQLSPSARVVRGPCAETLGLVVALSDGDGDSQPDPVVLTLS